MAAVLAIVVAAGAHAAEARSAPEGGVASVAPADTLLYVELNRPAEFWAALQKTDLRRAVRASLLAEFALNFTGATADLLCSSLTGRSMGDAAEHYDFTVGAVFAPPPPGGRCKNPDVVMLLEPRANADELQRLLAECLRQTLTARFPDVQIAEGRIAGHAVTDIAFSPKRVWTLAFPNKLVVYGRRRAVEWLLTSRRPLTADPRFAAARNSLAPEGPGIFCYAEVTDDAGQGAIFYGPGTTMTGVLTIEGPLVRDRLVLSGNIEPPRLGEPAPCSIGAVFPPGPWLVTQVSFASGAEMLRWVGNPILPSGRQADAALTGLAWLAITGDEKNIGTVLAAQIADRASIERRLAAIGFAKDGPAWRGPATTALISGNRLYIGRRRVMAPLVRGLTAKPNAPGARAATLGATPGFARRLGQLPGTSPCYSIMTGSFLTTAGGEESFKQFERVLHELPLSAASARLTDNGIEITSVSPAGYGIWLTAANISAALEDQ